MRPFGQECEKKAGSEQEHQHTKRHCLWCLMVQRYNHHSGINTEAAKTNQRACIVIEIVEKQVCALFQNDFINRSL
jgi:hypothetical protein